MIQQLDASGLYPVPTGEISIALLTYDEMCALHAQFLDDPTPTDVITFEGDPLAETAGEICVCPEVARNFAESHDANFATELALYIVHGYLHLAGLDDTTAKAKRAMRAAEKRAMAYLAGASALPAFRFEGH